MLVPEVVALPVTAKVLLPKVNVPVPVVKVKPLTVVKLGVADRVIWVDVPIKTCCPPLMERLEELTVKLPKVVVPIPPLAKGSTPVMAIVEVPDI